MSTVTHERPNAFRIGKVFSDSFAVLGRNLPLLAGLALIFSGLPTLVLLLFTGGADPTAIDDAAFMQPQFGPAFAIGGLVSLVLAMILQAAVVRAAIEDMSSKKPSFGDCLSTAIAVLLPSIGIGLIFFVVIALTMFVASLLAIFLGWFGIVVVIAAIVGIAMLFLRWCVALPVLVQERAGVFGSLRRSTTLTAGSRWALFGLFLIVLIVLVVLQFALGIVVVALPGLIGVLLSTAVSMVMSLVATIGIAISYVELRLVKEGTSVTELAEIFS